MHVTSYPGHLFFLASRTTLEYGQVARLELVSASSGTMRVNGVLQITVEAFIISTDDARVLVNRGLRPLRPQPLMRAFATSPGSSPIERWFERLAECFPLAPATRC